MIALLDRPERSTELRARPGCGALVPEIDGPVHEYVPSSPGCWKAFAELQADEASRFGYPPVHRVIVHAYMAQPPGDGGDRRHRQSVFVHLVGLCAVLERGLPSPYVTKLLGQVIRRRHREFRVLERAEGPGPVTVLAMIGASDLADHERRADEWGECGAELVERAARGHPRRARRRAQA